MTHKWKTWEIPKSEKYSFIPKKHKYCVIIPVINEGNNIRSVLQGMIKNKIHDICDIIVADGGSTDGSLDIPLLKKLHVRALLIKRDGGRLSAQLRMAYAYALEEGYLGVITFDGNNKDDPKGIRFFVDLLDKKYDLVHGSRYITGGQAINTPFIRTLGIKLIHSPILSLTARHWFTDTTSGFRGYSRKYLLDPRVKPFRNIFQTYELLAYLTVRAPQLGLSTIEAPITRVYPNGKIPTKIKGFKSNFELLTILLKTLLGAYNP